jgi:hypothetical protein
MELKYDYYSDKKGQERHLVINHQAERLIFERVRATEAQKELIDYAIQKYIEEQKRKIDANPQDYIKLKGDERTST